MNARKNAQRVAIAVLVAATSLTAWSACSSDNSNPSPDAGTDGTTGGSNSSSGSSSGSSNSSGSGSGSGRGSSGGSSGAGDSGCASDAMNCNSCDTPDADPYNSCSSFVTGCIPFDDTRVPTHPTL
jgi:hypothetical protein